MTEAAAAPTSAPRGRIHVERLLVGTVVAALLAVAIDQLGWDVNAWFGQLWAALTGVSPAYVVAGVVLQTVKTTCVALSWLAILRFAYPRGDIPFKPVLASYATGVALNGFLPAHIGTFVMMFLFLSFVSGSTLPGLLVGWPVQKLCFTVTGALAWVYLFAAVPGSFHLELGNLFTHPAMVAVIAVGGSVVVVLVVRLLWHRLEKLWAEAKVGGAILTRPRVYLVRVALPELGAVGAKLAAIGVFLAAYGIPVTFHTIVGVSAGNSVANFASVTPGAVGITQAVNAVSLSHVTDPATAAAYSLGQQLVTTAWNQIFAVCMLVWAFGWTGGKELVRQSYTKAKTQTAERRA